MSFRELNIPDSSSTVTVKIFDIVDDPQKVVVPAAAFFTPVAPGYENLTCPMFAFLVENTTTKQRVLFDLGPRKDLENGAPSVAAAVKAGTISMPVSKDIGEQLSEDGVELESISAAIWRCSQSFERFKSLNIIHSFPPAIPTRIIPAICPSSLLRRSSFSAKICRQRLMNQILTVAYYQATWSAESSLASTLTKSPLVIGGFKALDFFSDGSFYILDVPGHQSGHVCGLARVTPTSFVLLGADTCHHAGVLRPTSKLHRYFPCPGELLAATRLSVSPKSIHNPGSGEDFDLASRTTPLLTVAEGGAFEDPATSPDSIHKIEDFDANPDVFVILAHDASMGHLFRPYPAILDQWKAKGWKNEATWAFLEETNPAFRFAAKK